MVVYKCICGDSLEMTENTQIMLDTKKLWKKKHNKENPGHRYVRLVVKKKKRD